MRKNVRKCLLSFVLVLYVPLFCNILVAAPPPGPGYSWKLIFEDNFEGTSIDSSKWITQHPWSRTFKGDAYNRDENVTVQDGILTITAKAESFGGRPFTSGAISTGYSRFRFKYGYAEARLKLPKARGSWANFWMLDDGWPPEIDVMENPTNNETSHNRRFYTNYHYDGGSWGAWHQPGVDLSESFNTFGMEWRPGHMGFFFNDSRFRSGSASHFDQPNGMYLIFDYYVGGEWGNEVWANPDPATWPAPETGRPLYQIDWVRVWQRIRDTHLECIGHWRLDETDGTTAFDSSGKGMHATLMGGQSFDSDSVEGVFGRALRFDGQNDYIALPAGFDEFDNGFSVTLWARPTAVKNWARFIDLGNGAGNNNIILAREGTSNTLIFQAFGGTTGGGYVRANNAIDQDVWQFFAATIDTDGAVKLYKNGQVISTGTSTWPWGVFRLQNYIGRSNWSADDYYQGYMDDVRIFDYALSEQEVFNYFQAEIPQPFDSVPTPIPGRIQAERFDHGGLGVAYNDTTGGNSGGAFRPFEGVDIRTVNDYGSGYAITDIHADEWLRYTVNITETGMYCLYLRASSTADGVPVHLTLNDEPLATVTVNDTGSIDAFQTFVINDLELTAGNSQTLKLVFPQSNTFNVHWLQFELQGPYHGVPHTIPGKIQAEQYDLGGPAVAYFDTTPNNTSGNFRHFENVDVVSINDIGADYAIDNIETGEWLRYTVNSTATQTDIHFRVASIRDDGQILVWLDDELIATVDVPDTGSLTTWQTVAALCAPLPDRQNAVLTLEFVGSGFRVNWFQFANQTPFLGVPFEIPGRVDFKNYDLGGQLISFYDNSDVNGYGHYRPDEPVDIIQFGNDIVVFAEGGEWLEYTCNIEPGVYTIVIRNSIPYGALNGTLSIGNQIITPFTLPSTGGFTNWQNTVIPNVHLPGGQELHLRISLLTTTGLLQYMEFFREYNPADITQSGRVDIDDFAVLAAQWLGAPGTPSADIAPLPDGDGVVDMLDLLILADNWLAFEDDFYESE